MLFSIEYTIITLIEKIILQKNKDIPVHLQETNQIKLMKRKILQKKVIIYT